MVACTPCCIRSTWIFLCSMGFFWCVVIVGSLLSFFFYKNCFHVYERVLNGFFCLGLLSRERGVHNK
jgi:hypothetical protein